ncbi:alpha/beta fold hydrolase [Halobacillus litoralis]|uniref:alpha/beta hydrolase family protein n=1 Tax=Halobacillus litoralis TaxID=45668 RepID=UPI001CD6710A|nr:alpha/beta fold hydrolase [Halobacillus litoralis]MCA0969277.1 alpha/beta fold hydrolase [Halobacillus litoralis]
MRHYFVRKEEIVGDLLIPSDEDNLGIGLVWLPGLPNQPLVEDMTHNLAAKGFTVLNARYPGSWQSYGRFGPASSVEGANLGLELLNEGETTDLPTMETVRWNVNRLVLVGNSYGGAIAVTALAKNDLADGAVAFCPMLDPGAQNDRPDEPEEDLTTMLPFLKRCHENTFRDIDPLEWNAFIKGEHLCNPVDYITELKDKRMLFIHGTEDVSIRPRHTLSFYEKLKKAGADQVELKVVESIGHGRKLRTSTESEWVRWLVKHFS